MTIMLDRANVNGSDDYRQAHDAGGVRWAVFKATEGQGFVDATYHARRSSARANGILTGAYMFSDNTDPVAEVEHFLVVIGEPGVRVGEFRPTIDIERSPHGIPTLEHTIAMAEHLHSKLGYWPIIYGSTSVLAPYRAASIVLRACPWWRAEYGPNDGHDHALQGGDLGAAIHQYTSVGRVSGVSGFTDLSHILRADQTVVPKPKPSKPKVAPAVSWRWARWYLGLAEYHGHQRDPELRPHAAPRVIPLGWYGKVRWYKKHVIRPDRKAAKQTAKISGTKGVTVEAPTPDELAETVASPIIVDGNGDPLHPLPPASPPAPRRSHRRTQPPKEGQ